MILILYTIIKHIVVVINQCVLSLIALYVLPLITVHMLLISAFIINTMYMVLITVFGPFITLHLL